MNSHQLLPSAIVCSCGKRFSSAAATESGSDQPSSNRRLQVANDSSALWLFLRHHAARIASPAGQRQTHRAASIFVRCFFCSNDIDVNKYRQHIVESDCGRPNCLEAIHRCRLRERNYCAYKCEKCPDAAVGSPLEHSHPFEAKPVSFELFITCRECRCQLPVGDAVGHAAFWHAECIAKQSPKAVADLFWTEKFEPLPPPKETKSDPSRLVVADFTVALPDDWPAEATPSSTADSSSLVAGSRSRIRTRPFSGAIPGLRFPREKRARLFECEICGSRFFDRRSSKFDGDNLLQHWRQHLPPDAHTCRFCHVAFGTAALLHRHLSSRHKATQGEPNAADGYRCIECFALFQDNAALVEHAKAKHKRELRVPCSQCDLVFSCYNSRAKHIKEEHVVERPFACTQCADKFVRPCDLRNHMRKHTGENPRAQKCPECDRVMSSKTRLNDHIVSKHRAERPHCCQECGKGFVSQTALIVHKRTHTGERPFLCDLCGQGYRTKEVLKWHRSHSHK